MEHVQMLSLLKRACFTRACFTRCLGLRPRPIWLWGFIGSRYKFCPVANINTRQWTHREVKCTCVQMPVHSVLVLGGSPNWGWYHRFHQCRWWFPLVGSPGSKVTRAPLLETPACAKKGYTLQLKPKCLNIYSLGSSRDWKTSCNLSDVDAVC